MSSFQDDLHLDPDRPMECAERVDLMKSMQWAAWKARAIIDDGFYSIGYLDEVRERKLFEKWYQGLTNGAA